MAAETKIEWCDHTFNPVIGCQAVSPACDHCYAEAQVTRFGGDFAKRRRTSAAKWREPIRWNSLAAIRGIRPRVFCASLADAFDNQWEPQWRADLWALIAKTPQLDWLLLTKRPQNIAKMLPDGWGDGWPNVWLGTTVENQAEADRRIPLLLAVPARVHFLSCEPLLGMVDLTAIRGFYGAPTDRRMDRETVRERSDVLRGSDRREHLRVDGTWNHRRLDDPNGDPVFTGNCHASISWVIAGGESGPKARDTPVEWFRFLRDQCAGAGVAFFMKQMTRKAPIPHDLMVREWPDA